MMGKYPIGDNFEPRWRITYESIEAEKCEGMNGQALHLSGTAVIRKAVSVPNPLKDHRGDFSISLWIKGEAHSEFGSRSFEILSASCCTADENESGCKLGLQQNGAWYWKALGEETYTYEPTFARQPIRDGLWHQLSFTYSIEKQEVRLYYDGVNMAIYSVQLQPEWNQAETLWIGGESKDGSERETFPGWIDELWIEDRALTVEEIENLYSIHRIMEPPPSLNSQSSILNVMTFNIWNGGREMGAEIGVQRVIDVIRDSGADIISMQETYGSGPIIADELGY